VKLWSVALACGVQGFDFESRMVTPVTDRNIDQKVAFLARVLRQRAEVRSSRMYCAMSRFLRFFVFVCLFSFLVCLLALA